MILFDIGSERCRLNYVRIVTANRAQGASDILAALPQLRSHITGVHRGGVDFTPGSHSGDEY
jgi:hypothetical protein